MYLVIGLPAQPMRSMPRDMCDLVRENLTLLYSVRKVVLA